MIWRLLLLVMICHNCLMAQDMTPKVGQSYQTTKVDLNHDGQLETVGLTCVKRSDEGWFSLLSVWDSSKRLIWQSQAAKEEPWSFGGWDWGVSDLHLVDDIDGDGHIEVVSPQPVSDVSPVHFRIYRWNGKAFTYVRTAALISDGSDKYFSWGQALPERAWVGKLRSGPTGEIWSLSNETGVQTRTVKLQADRHGFKVVK